MSSYPQMSSRGGGSSILCVPSSTGPPLRSELLDFSAQVLVDARSGITRRLDSLWYNSPVVLVFLRRLGCALCRTLALEFSEARDQIEATGATLVAISFEELGKGSDANTDKGLGFEEGGYWKGPLYTVSPDVYGSLFGRKGLFSGFYGLADVSKTKLAACTARDVRGNYKGDGLLLGGQFIVNKGGNILREKRQAYFGDDLTADETLDVLNRAILVKQSNTPLPLQDDALAAATVEAPEAPEATKALPSSSRVDDPKDDDSDLTTTAREMEVDKNVVVV
jgi:hypothetical protein